MAKANPEKQEQLKQDFEVVKKIAKPQNWSDFVWRCEHDSGLSGINEYLASKGVFFSTTVEIRNAVKSFMDEISKEPMRIIDRLCIQM